MNEAPTRATDPQTSLMAAAKVPTAKHKRYVLRALRGLHLNGKDAATDRGILTVVQRNHPEVTPESIRTRRSKLVSEGLVEEHGFITNEKGNKATCWRLTFVGRGIADKVYEEDRRR